MAICQLLVNIWNYLNNNRTLVAENDEMSGKVVWV